MAKTMKYITVLDFENGSVFQYNLTKFGDNYIFEDKDCPQGEEIEEILGDLGILKLKKEMFAK